ncbi:MAG: hypothetical protein ACREBS_03895 [Nitrososphaerales archaeon]
MTTETYRIPPICVLSSSTRVQFEERFETLQLTDFAGINHILNRSKLAMPIVRIA